MMLLWPRHGMRKRTVAALAALLALSTSACRPSEPKTFRGHNVSFSYPGSWTRVEGTSLNMPPSSPLWAVSVGVDDTNSVTVAAYRVNALITEENLGKLEGSITDNIRSIVNRSGSTIVGDATETSVDGLPALRFEVVDDAGDVTSNLHVAFRENTEYYVKCTYTDDHNDDVGDGCNQVVESIDLRS